MHRMGKSLKLYAPMRDHPDPTFQIQSIDFNDTFLSFDHLRQSFPRYDVKAPNGPPPLPPFRVTFEESEKPSLSVDSIVRIKRGPYPFNAPKKNNIMFTPTQVEAIRSGVNPGLTLIVGPPGIHRFQNTSLRVWLMMLSHDFPPKIATLSIF